MPRLDPDKNPPPKSAKKTASTPPSSGGRRREQRQLRQHNEAEEALALEVRPAKTFSPAMVSAPKKAKPVDVNVALPSGESFSQWFDRRLRLVSGGMGFLPLSQRLVLASSPLSDRHLEAIGSAVPQVRAYVDGKFRGPQPSGGLKGPEARGAKDARGFVPSEAEEDAAEELEFQRARPEDIGLADILATIAVIGGGAAALYAGAAGLGGAAALAAAGAETGAVATSGLGGLLALGEGVSSAVGLAGGRDVVYEAVNKYALEPFAAGVDVAVSAVPGGRKMVSFDEALENARRQGAGSSIVDSLGIDPGSHFGRLLAAGIEILGQSKVSPGAVGAKVASAEAKARLVPRASQGVRTRSLVERAALRALSVDDPAEIVFEGGRLSAASKKVWKDFQKYRGNQNALRRLYPDLERNAAAFEVLALAKSEREFGDALASLLRGESAGVTRTALLARADTLMDEFNSLDERLAKIPEKDMRGVKPQARIDLERERADVWMRAQKLREAADSPVGQVFLRAIPSKSIFDDMRVAYRSADDGIMGRLGHLLDADWARKASIPWFVRLPKKGISLEDAGEGRETLDRLGRLLNLKRERTDELVNSYLSASSFSERREIIIEMLDEGKKRLPKSVAERLTQAYDSPANSIYWIDRQGERLSDWVKRRKNKHGDTVSYQQPEFWHQLAQDFPLPDIRGIIEARTWGGRTRLALKHSGRVGGGIAESWKAVNHVLHFATAGLWAPLQLFKLGWMLKITGEERIRMVARGLPRHEDNVLSFFGRLKKGISDVPEEALTDYARGLLGDYLPAKGIVRRTERGYEYALRDELLALHQDPVVRHLVRFGVDDTVEWLESGAGAYYRNTFQRVLDGVEGGADARSWVVRQDRLLRERFSDDVLDVIRTGKLDGVDLRKPAMLSQIQRTSRSLPAYARQYGEYWRTSGGLVAKGAAAWFNWAGSKSTNYLNRSRAFGLFYEGELRRVRSFGVDESVAQASAREYAIRQVRDLLYDSAERAAHDQLIRTIAPFFPAWKEVLKTWTYTLPKRYGNPIIGHAVYARKFAIVKEALEEQKLVYKSEDGRWKIDTPFGEVDAASFNILGNWPIGGPVVSVVAAQLAKGSERWEAFLKPLQPFGVEPNLGPVTLNRLWMGVFESPPPWEVFSRDYQNQMWSGAQIDWMRSEGFERYREILAMPANTDAERQAQKNAIEKWRDDAKSGAARYFLERGVKGWLLPFQPRKYWKNQKEWLDFQKTISDLEGADRSGALREFLDEHPELALFAVGKSVRLKGAQKRDDAIDEYWRAWRHGDVKRYSAEEWSELAVFLGDYHAARNIQREALANIGTDRDSWLRNMGAVQEANRVFSDKLDRLRISNPDGYRIWRERVEAAARREGDPLPDVEEQQLMDFTRSFALIQEKIEAADPLGDRFDLQGMKDAMRLLRTNLDIDRYFRDSEDMEPGVERDVAAYFDAVYAPYWERIAELRAPLDDRMASKEEKQRARLEVQRFRNSFEGDVNPEEVSFSYKTDDQKQVARMRWAATDPAFLTRFQRTQIGVRDDDTVVEFWERVREVDIEAGEYIRSQGWTSSQKEAKNVRAQVEAWKLETARKHGLEQELLAEEAPRYERMRVYGVLPEALERAAEVADAAWARLRSEPSADGDGVGPTSKLGMQVFRTFYEWFRGLIASDPELQDSLTSVWAAAPQDVRERGLDSIGFQSEGLLAWLFFGS